MNRNKRNNFHISRKAKHLFNMSKKSKKILLITSLSTIGAAIVAVPTGLALSKIQLNKSSKTIKLDDTFLKDVSTFIIENKINSFNDFNSLFVDKFSKFLFDKFNGATFSVRANQNLIYVEITNDFDFNTEIKLDNVSITSQKTLEIIVSWYDPIEFSISSNDIYNLVQSYLINNKVGNLSSLVKNNIFISTIVTKINELNPSVLSPLTNDDIIIKVSSESSLIISIQNYVDKVFVLTDTEQNTDVVIVDNETQKEILINNLTLFSAKVTFNNELVNKIQNLSMNEGLIAPSYFANSDKINVTNDAFINSIVNVLNSGTTNEYIVDATNIQDISYTIVDRNASYNNLLPNVAKIKFNITLTNGYFESNETSTPNFSLSNKNKTLSIDLCVYNGIFVSDRMANSSSNINKFISNYQITLSNASNEIYSKNGQYADFWYTLLTGDDFNNVTDIYYECINEELYTMDFQSSSISITLNDNCGYRFYAPNLTNGDVTISNNYKTITINNINWTKGTTKISTTNATNEKLQEVFMANSIYESSLIETFKKQIVNTIFPNLPVANCSIIYDNGTITFTIINNSSSNTNYMFNVDGTLTNTYKISGVTFPTGKIYPVSNYESLIKSTIFNNLISTKEQLENYLLSIISQIFNNSLKTNQYTIQINEVSSTVTLTINNDINLVFVTTSESNPSTSSYNTDIIPPTEIESKTFTFNYKLCREINIVSDYESRISSQFLQDNSINATNVTSNESISKILMEIIDTNENKEELVASISNSLIMNYVEAPLKSKIIISKENTNVLDEPFTFVIDNINVGLISVVLEFVDTGTTNPTSSQLSKFFRSY